MRVVSTVARVGSGLVAVVVAALPGSAQANCQWYATTALKQQQDNERLKCGFKGPAWSGDLKAHMSWCATVAPELWRAAAQKRDQELAQCSAAKR